MERHPDVPFWLCVGDVGSRTGAYPQPPAPLYWIKGNNEDFNRIAAWEAGRDPVSNLHLIPNGTSRTVGPLTVAGLGGTYAPTWYERRAVDLPRKARDDKRRHFVREQVEACKRMRGIDILMTHEAARPFVVVDELKEGRKLVYVASPSDATGRRWLDGPRKQSVDAGKPAINDMLASMQPRLHLCGHHHRFVESTREGVRSVCIDRVNRSYLLIDAATLEYRRIDQ
jgi:Icc-related predicted phosphoesterase